jgi:hypothetical protein
MCFVSDCFSDCCDFDACVVLEFLELAGAPETKQLLQARRCVGFTVLAVLCSYLGCTFNVGSSLYQAWMRLREI